MVSNIHQHYDKVLHSVCQALKLDIHDVRGSSRLTDLVDARVIYANICIKAFREDKTYQGIGIVVNRDHSSIVYYRKKFDEWKFDKVFQKKWRRCTYVLSNTENDRYKVKKGEDIVDTMMIRNSVLASKYLEERDRREKLEVELSNLKKKIDAREEN